MKAAEHGITSAVLAAGDMLSPAGAYSIWEKGG